MKGGGAYGNKSSASSRFCDTSATYLSNLQRFFFYSKKEKTHPVSDAFQRISFLEKTEYMGSHRGAATPL